MNITKHRLLNILALSLLITAATLFTSCSVKNEVNLSADGSGSASTDTVLNESLVFYLESLSELTGEDNQNGLFNVDELKAGIEKNPGLSVKSIKNYDDRRITAEINFDNIEQLISETEKTLNKQIISFKEYGNEKEIHIYIDIDNFNDIAPLFPIVDEPLFRTFGPLENQGLSEEDYLEMMEFALGDGGGEMIKKSVISTTINIDGTLISQKGGIVNGKNSVTFEIPLIRILLLDKPIEYTVRFK